MNRNVKVLMFALVFVILTNTAHSMYCTKTGRFLQKDQLGTVPDGKHNNNKFKPHEQYNDSLSLYLYINANPYSNNDAYGLVKWYPNKDTGENQPIHEDFSNSPIGDRLIAKTDKGTELPIWKPHDGKTYWCHGYTFGGSAAQGGPYSIFGQYVPKILIDEGWGRIKCSWARPNKDIALFFKEKDMPIPYRNILELAHSGIITSTACNLYPHRFSEIGSKLRSKPGYVEPLSTLSFADNVSAYGKYACYSKEAKKIKKEAQKNKYCCGLGKNELPFKE